MLCGSSGCADNDVDAKAENDEAAFYMKKRKHQREEKEKENAYKMHTQSEWSNSHAVYSRWMGFVPGGDAIMRYARCSVRMVPMAYEDLMGQTAEPAVWFFHDCVSVLGLRRRRRKHAAGAIRSRIRDAAVLSIDGVQLPRACVRESDGRTIEVARDAVQILHIIFI